jgi:ClpP class serine protease
MWLMERGAREALENTTISEERAEAIVNGGNAPPPPEPLAGGPDVAVIPIEGVMTERPDFRALLFGGGNTTYQSIMAGVAEAEADASVQSIELAFGTAPGGNVNGLFPVMDAISNASKPVRATVRNLAASAAYMIASQASEGITALNDGARVGSIGVVMEKTLDPNLVSIASTQAPKKAPDANTDEGRAAIREQVDASHAFLVGKIAAGRGITAEEVNEKYGKGSVLFAQEALDAGMIDRIESKSTATKGSGTTQEESMDFAKLKAEHPDVYQACVAEGEKQERARVAAHLKLGKASGDMETALQAIADGAGLTVELQATYMAASMNKNEEEARQGDNPPQLDGGDGGEEPNAMEKIADMVAEDGAQDFLEVL